MSVPLLFKSDGGMIADHPQQTIFPILASPTPAQDFNHVRLSIFPVGCLRLNDLRFAFDSSIVKAEAEQELKQLPLLMANHPDSPLSVFGHADPVGRDDYNKTLSGRRAIAIYALLTRRTDLWLNLYNNPFGGDDWRNWKAGGPMLVRLGYTADPAGLQRFQSDHGLPATGQSSDDTRRAYFLAYMDAIGPPILTADQFLGRGLDPQGKADYQGCSEFNPVVMFSADENQTLLLPQNKADRDFENAPNRRVVIYLFCTYAKLIDPNQWPCPRASEGSSGCQARFWSDASVKRQFQAQHRKYEDTRDTFACRFYDRLACLSPCEGIVVPFTTLITVRLRLVFTDPEGKDRPFPPGFPVVVVFGNGTELPLTVGQDGRLAFDADPTQLSVTLRFESGNQLFIASAPGPPATGSEEMIFAPEVANHIDNGFRLFQCPLKWSMDNSDWAATGAAFGNNRIPLEGVATIGSDASPVLLRLNPHWQYLRFSYFDRALKKRLSVPQMMIEGFLDSAQSSGVPDTRSNWVVDPGDLGSQCLPWILQTPPKPDPAVLLRFRYVPGSFVSSNTDGTRVLLSLDKLNPNGTDPARVTDPGLNAGAVKSFVIDQPNPDRLRLYDLPVVWKSQGYATLQNVGGNPSLTLFKDAAVASTTANAPLIFSLDDMVLMQFGGGVLTPLSPFEPGVDRVAIYSNTFQPGDSVALSNEGLFIADVDNKQPHFTQQVAFLDKKINYVAVYPDWTRLVIAQGNLFDVFDQRTPDSPTAPVGARAAVRWLDATPVGGIVPAPGTPMANRPGVQKPQSGQNFFRIEPFYEQRQDLGSIPRPPGFRNEHANPRAEANTRSAGRVDVAVLRCCDLQDGIEVAVCLNYFRLFFNGNPAFPPGLEPAAVPSGLSGSDAEDWGILGITNMLKRWNGNDIPFSTARPQAKPTGSEKVRFDLLWLAQNLPRAIAHFEIGLFKMPPTIVPPRPVRASMDPFNGFATLDVSNNIVQETTTTPPHFGGDLVFAHEMGHAGSLDDEYDDSHLAYNFPWLISPAPGCPFLNEFFAMMFGGYFAGVGRYWWQFAEWLRSVYNIDLLVQYYPTLQYKLPHHPLAPRRTHVNWPLAEAIDVRAATDPRLSPHAGFDAYLYPSGSDLYLGPPLAMANATPIDGILVVLVKLRVALHTTVDAVIRDILFRMFTVVDFMLNVNPAAKVIASGAINNWTFKRCPVLFQPRLLVETVSDDPNFLAINNVPDAATYKNFVNGVESQHRVHFHVRTKASGPAQWTGPTSVEVSGDPGQSLDFGLVFVEMLGLPPGTPLTGASFTPIVQSVLPGGSAAFL